MLALDAARGRAGMVHLLDLLPFLRVVSGTRHPLHFPARADPADPGCARVISGAAANGKGGKSADLPARRVALVAALVLACATIALAAPWKGLRRDPLASYRLPPGYEALRIWLHEHASKDAPVMLGPSHAYAYFWDARLEGCIVPVPWTTTDALRPAMRAAGARYAVLDYSLLRNRADLRAWVDAADDSVRLVKLPAPWRVAFRDPADPPAFIVLAAD